jgi:hypothetical protein
VEGCCECGTEPMGSIESSEVLEWLHNWRFLSSIELVVVVKFGNNIIRIVLRLDLLLEPTCPVL